MVTKSPCCDAKIVNTSINEEWESVEGSCFVCGASLIYSFGLDKWSFLSPNKQLSFFSIEDLEQFGKAP